MAMRSTWTGQLGFGLVQFPVALYKATDNHDVSFHQHHGPTCMGGVAQKRVCKECGEDVVYGDIVKGIEVGGTLVTVTEDDFAQLEGERGKQIEITQFVDQSQIDPIMFEDSYYLGGGKVGGEKVVRPSKAYALLVNAMASSGLVAIAEFTMRNKTHMAAIRAVEGVLVLHTLRWADEVREATVPGLGADFSAAELDMAERLVASMTGKFDPDAHVDTYTNRLNELIEAKAEGGVLEVEQAADLDSGDVSDLLAKLEASVATKGGKK
jgi:DNA end-binding protein Ku